MTQPHETLVERLLWHVEQVCGPLSTEAVVVPGDDDRSILADNFTILLHDATPSPFIVGELVEALRDADTVLRHAEFYSNGTLCELRKRINATLSKAKGIRGEEK